MKMDTPARRRWFGALCLAAALVMLLCGQTFLKDRLNGSVFLSLLYWLACFVFTGLAMIAALRDLRFVSRTTRQERRQLLEDTLKQIETEARKKTE